MSDDQSGQKSNTLIQVGGLLGAVAVTTTALATIVNDGSTIWEKLPFAKASGTAESSTSSPPNPQLNQPRNKANISATPSLPEKYEYTENGKTNAFVHVSEKVWKEDEFGREFNTFKEIERDSDFITIYDKSREMKIKIPIEGGQTLVTWEDANWVDTQYRYVAKKFNAN